MVVVVVIIKMQMVVGDIGDGSGDDDYGSDHTEDDDDDGGVGVYCDGLRGGCWRWSAVLNTYFSSIIHLTPVFLCNSTLSSLLHTTTYRLVGFLICMFKRIAEENNALKSTWVGFAKAKDLRHVSLCACVSQIQ